MILPAEQPAKPAPNYRRNESISVLVSLDHFHGFIFPQNAMRRDEMLGADCHFLTGVCLNVANPVRIGPKTIRNDNLGTLLPIFDDF